MSSISGLGSILPPQKPQGTAAAQEAPAPQATPGSVADRLELSGVSHLLQTLKTAGDVRVDKVADLKAQIEAGRYDADGSKLDGATHGLLDDLEIQRDLVRHIRMSDAVSPPDDLGHFCPDCGYDLRGIASPRCPECGLKIDPHAVTSRIAWANRKFIGRFPAFWRTLIRATFSPKALAGAAAGPVEFRSGQIFRWTVVAAASIPIAAFLVGLFASHGGTNGVNLLGDNPMQNISWGAAGSWPGGFSWEMAFLWSAGATLWPILPLGILVSFFLGTAAARFWFAPSRLPATLRQRAVAMSEYACAPLAWMVVPVIALVGALIAHDQPDDAFWHTFELLSMVYFIGFVLILLAWWWSTLRLLSRTTHCSAGRLLAAGALVPVGWIFSAAIGLAVFPALAGLLWLMFDSLR